MFQRAINFLNEPFSPDMSAVDWFLFYGLLLIIALMWRMIIQAYADL